MIHIIIQIFYRHSTHRRGKEKGNEIIFKQKIIKNFLQGLENVTDSEEHLDEPILPKQSKFRQRSFLLRIIFFQLLLKFIIQWIGHHYHVTNVFR